MKKAFTLIELLIVVAIIAILAAIAVPNFLEAQTRAKVSRAKADMRTLDTCLMAYYVDNNAFPLCNIFALPGQRSIDPNDTFDVLERLTTPISYCTNVFFQDPFQAKWRTGSINAADGSFTPNANPTNPGSADEIIEEAYGYSTPGISGLQDINQKATDKANFYFVLASAGPFLHNYNLSGLLSSSATPETVIRNIYDASNGTVSIGGIFRVNGVSTGEGNYGGQFFSTVSRIN